MIYCPRELTFLIHKPQLSLSSRLQARTAKLASRYYTVLVLILIDFFLPSVSYRRWNRTGTTTPTVCGWSPGRPGWTWTSTGRAWRICSRPDTTAVRRTTRNAPRTRPTRCWRTARTRDPRSRRRTAPTRRRTRSTNSDTCAWRTTVDDPRRPGTWFDDWGCGVDAGEGNS